MTKVGMLLLKVKEKSSLLFCSSNLGLNYFFFFWIILHRIIQNKRLKGTSGKLELTTYTYPSSLDEYIEMAKHFQPGVVSLPLAEDFQL